MRIAQGILISLVLLMTRSIAGAQNGAVQNPNSASSSLAGDLTKTTAAAVANNASIPIGTVITTANWRQYKDFMPDGMVKLFAGEYSLKMPDAARIEIGPPVIHSLPKGYLDATEKYAGQVKLIELPDGGLTRTGYQGGIPFPNPADPHKGWKILANLWYRYMPYLAVFTHASGCVVSNGSGIHCKYAHIVYRQLSFNTDPGIPVNIPGAEGKFYSQWVMSIEPEEEKYQASLTISSST